MEFFSLKHLRVSDSKNDDLFKIESANYETLELDGDQLIDLLLQILCWQRTWHLDCKTNDGEVEIVKCIETLFEYYGGKNTVSKLSGGAQ